MLFNSIEFAVFSVVVCLLYYSPIFRNRQVWFLVAASLVFYSWGQPKWLLLLIFSIGINSVASWQIMSRTGRAAKITWSAACIIINVVLLASFKYAALAASLLAGAGDANSLFSLLAQLPLPIGISFYTFEGISLLVDSIRRPPELSTTSRLSHIRNTSLFFSFFPHLAAGPIVRPHQLFPQIGGKRFQDIDWKCVLENLIIGYFLKNVVADNLVPYTRVITFYSAQVSGAESACALVAYSASLFADFAGYSLIAIGLAAAFGYKLPVNFNFPYRSQSLAEFWTRWHITLSLWIKDYLYIPLGGNKKGTLRTYFNLLTVMFLGGLWHGGKVGFALWGIYHGVGLCLERMLGFSHGQAKSVPLLVVRIVAAFIFVTLGWSVFVLPLHMVPSFFSNTMHNWRWTPDKSNLFMMVLFSAPVFIWHIADVWKEKNASIKFPPVVRECCLAAMIFLVITSSGVPQEFVYFQF